MMLTRRDVLTGCAAAVVLVLTTRRVLAQPIDQALETSDLVYLTPLRSDGSESRCQAEIWFVHDDQAVFVVTASGAWRARAVRAGLDRARIWVGDMGNWKRAEGAYRAFPQIEARGQMVTDAVEQARVLALYGEKYPLSWLRWGPRFRNGLADGSRVMIRYQPVG